MDNFGETVNYLCGRSNDTIHFVLTYRDMLGFWKDSPRIYSTVGSLLSILEDEDGYLYDNRDEAYNLEFYLRVRKDNTPTENFAMYIE